MMENNYFNENERKSISSFQLASYFVACDAQNHCGARVENSRTSA